VSGKEITNIAKTIAKKNADISDLNVMAMEVNGRFYVGQNNTEVVWAVTYDPKKSEKKVTYATKESLDQQPWKKKGLCVADKVFSSLFLGQIYFLYVALPVFIACLFHKGPCPLAKLGRA